MNTVTENDIRELKDLIKDIKTDLEKNQIRLEGKLETLEENLNGKITTLTETIKGVDKRLDGIEILNRIVSGGFIVGILLALTKYLFFSNNNI